MAKEYKKKKKRFNTLHAFEIFETTPHHCSDQSSLKIANDQILVQVYLKNRKKCRSNKPISIVNIQCVFIRRMHTHLEWELINSDIFNHGVGDNPKLTNKNRMYPPLTICHEANNNYRRSYLSLKTTMKHNDAEHLQIFIQFFHL